MGVEGRLAQRLERPPYTRNVGGSNPSSPTCKPLRNKGLQNLLAASLGPGLRSLPKSMCPHVQSPAQAARLLPPQGVRPGRRHVRLPRVGGRPQPDRRQRPRPVPGQQAGPVPRAHVQVGRLPPDRGGDDLAGPDGGGGDPQRDGRRDGGRRGLWHRAAEGGDEEMRRRMPGEGTATARIRWRCGPSGRCSSRTGGGPVRGGSQAGRAARRRARPTRPRPPTASMPTEAGSGMGEVASVPE